MEPVVFIQKKMEEFCNFVDWIWKQLERCFVLGVIFGAFCTAKDDVCEWLGVNSLEEDDEENLSEVDSEDMDSLVHVQSLSEIALKNTKAETITIDNAKDEHALSAIKDYMGRGSMPSLSGKVILKNQVF